MKIGFLAKQDSFAVEMFNELKQQRAQDELLHWLPEEKAPATDLDRQWRVGPGVCRAAAAARDGRRQNEELAWTPAEKFSQRKPLEGNRTPFRSTVGIA